jgi:hypothetical protein
MIIIILAGTRYSQKDQPKHFTILNQRLQPHQANFYLYNYDKPDTAQYGTGAEPKPR